MQWAMMEVAVLGLLIGCASEQVVSVLPARPAAGVLIRRARPPVLVRIESTAARLPLAVSGSDVAYADVDRAVHDAVERAIVVDTEKLPTDEGQSYELLVELIDAQAEYSNERLVVRLAALVTFRRATGNVYIAQTHARCSSAAFVAPQRGAGVVMECAVSLANDLGRWLSGLEQVNSVTQIE